MSNRNRNQLIVEIYENYFSSWFPFDFIQWWYTYTYVFMDYILRYKFNDVDWQADGKISWLLSTLNTESSILEYVIPGRWRKKREELKDSLLKKHTLTHKNINSYIDSTHEARNKTSMIRLSLSKNIRRLLASPSNISLPNNWPQPRQWRLHFFYFLNFFSSITWMTKKKKKCI